MKFLNFIFLFSFMGNTSSMCESKVKAEITEIIKQGNEKASFKFRVLNSKKVADQGFPKCPLKTFTEAEIEVERNGRTFITGEVVELNYKEISALSENGVVSDKSWSLN